MTLPGRRQMDEHTRRILARLFKIHLSCHPKRVAALVGCTPQQVRAVWRESIELGWEFELSRAREDLELLERQALRRVQKFMAPISDKRAPVIIAPVTSQVTLPTANDGSTLRDGVTRPAHI